jgi:hypothetical protein
VSQKYISSYHCIYDIAVEQVELLYCMGHSSSALEGMQNCVVGGGKEKEIYVPLAFNIHVYAYLLQSIGFLWFSE